MKTCLLVGAVLTLAPNALPMQADEPAKATESAYSCPLFSIDDYPPSALYYCDYKSASCEWLDVSFWFGVATTVPYVNCPGDCKPVEEKDAHVATHAVFPGLPAKVPLDYMHKPPQKRDPAAQGFPAEAVGVGVNKNRDCHFVKFSLGGKDVYAKVIELRFNRPIAELRKGASDADIDGKWESKFVAFEVEKNPADSGYEFQPIAEVKPLGDYVLRGRIVLAPGQAAPVLILLAGQGNAAKKAD